RPPPPVVSLVPYTTLFRSFDKGLLTKCDDYKALADLIGTDEATIKETIEGWIETVKNNEDKEFGREGMDETRSDLSVAPYYAVRSEEHTSELQSRFDLVCR